MSLSGLTDIHMASLRTSGNCPQVPWTTPITGKMKDRESVYQGMHQMHFVSEVI